MSPAFDLPSGADRCAWHRLLTKATARSPLSRASEPSDLRAALRSSGARILLHSSSIERMILLKCEPFRTHRRDPRLVLPRS
jgi:hypothetical protein